MDYVADFNNAFIAQGTRQAVEISLRQHALICNLWACTLGMHPCSCCL